MIKKKYKRTSSFIFAIVFIISMMPLVAFATENTNEVSNIEIATEVSDSAVEKSSTQKGGNKANMLKGMNVSGIPASNQLAPVNSFMASSSSNGVYNQYMGFLNSTGHSLFLFPIYLDHGQVLHIQMDVPAVSNLDYDLYLYEIDSNNVILGLVDYSLYATYINGASGSLSEAVGVVNKSGSQKIYAAQMVSFSGGSTSIPFYLHVATNTVSDSSEVDENIISSSATPFTLSTNNNTVINSRQRDTLADNDWFVFTAPSGTNSFTISTNEAPVEIYRRTLGDEMILQTSVNTNNSNVQFNTTSGVTYYMRVHTAGRISSLSNSNYSIIFTPVQTITSITLNSSSFSGGTANITYGFGTRYRINSSANLTVSGTALNGSTPVANAAITVTIRNNSFSGTRTGTATTNSNGQFTATVQAPTAAGAHNFLVMTNPTIRHHYDLGEVWATGGTTNSTSTPLYIYSHSTNF